MKTKLNPKLLTAAVAGILGIAVYAYTSFTGYLAASATNMLPFVGGGIALVCILALLAAGDKLPSVVYDVVLVAAAVALIVGLAQFVLARTSLAADVYFIPVNYPASEETALNISIVGAIGYLVGIIALIVEGFTAKN